MVGMHVYFHPITQGYPQKQNSKGTYGNAILSKLPILETRDVIYPLHTGYSSSQEKRGACAVRTEGNVWFVCTHLGCDVTGYEQQAQAKGLFDFANSLLVSSNPSTSSSSTSSSSSPSSSSSSTESKDTPSLSSLASLSSQTVPSSLPSPIVLVAWDLNSTPKMSAIRWGEIEGGAWEPSHFRGRKGVGKGGSSGGGDLCVLFSIPFGVHFTL